MRRRLEVTKAAGVDVLIANHPEHDHAIEKNEILQTLKKGDPNPYVIGVDAFQRYMQLMGECSRMVLARAGVVE